MVIPRCFIALIWWGMLGAAGAQSSPTSPAPTPTSPARTPDHGAAVADRYRAMLASNPTEGMALDRLWKYHEERGSTSALIDLYQQAALAPDAPISARLIYGHLLKKIGRLDDAAHWYDTAAREAPADPLPMLALASLADLRNQPEEAVKYYTGALDKIPGGDRRRSELLLKAGTALLAAGKTEEAAETWEKIVALNPADFAVRRQLADAYEKNGLTDRAIGHHEYIEAHAPPPDRAVSLRDLGRLQEARGRFEEARDALERGLALTSRENWLHADLQTRLIRLYQRAGRAPELAARWREMVAQAPRDLGGYLRLEALAEAEGDLAAEREWLEKIVGLAPRDRDNTLKLAGRLAEVGDARRAGEMYDGLLQQQPGSLDLILARAALEVQLGQLTEATRRIEARVQQSFGDESMTAPALNFFLTHHLNEAAERQLRAGVARSPTVPETSLALAKFLFSQRRVAEARATLTTLLGQPGDAATRAQRHVIVADAFREAGLLTDAVRCWREAVRLNPAEPAPLLAAADVLRSDGDVPGAVEILGQAVSLSAGEAAGITVEKKLFDTLWSEQVGGQPTAAGPVSPSPSSDGSKPGTNSLLGKHLAALEEKANTAGTVADFLRLARWSSWSHDDKKAFAALNEVLVLDPGNVPARDLLASVADESNQPDVAERVLTEILELDPTRESSILRQLAKLKSQAGDNDGSLRLFTRLQQLSPGSRTALTDLALAQQRADRWFDALSTWESAYGLPGSTPTQRADIRRPLLGACEHLGKFARSVDILVQAVDEQTDVSAKDDLFRQLTELAYKHGLGEQLAERFDERLRRKPDDYFTLTARAQLYREAGDPEEAYRLLKKAHYSAPDPVRSLGTLVQEADLLGKTDDAVAHLTRLVALPGQFTADNLQKQADLQEENQDGEAASRTWNTVVARFPRDPSALGKASEYFERIDQTQRASDLQRQAVALDGTDLQRTARLAVLDSRSGKIAAALDDYETILTRTSPELPGDPLIPPDGLTLPDAPLYGVFPGAARTRSRPSTVVAPSKPPVKTAVGDQALRFQTIGEMSRLLFPKADGEPPAPTSAQTAWLTRWKTAAAAGLRNEPLRAFYAAGQKDAMMALLAGWLDASKSRDPGVRNAFLVAGLKTGDYSRLGAWAWARGEDNEMAERVPAMLAALEQYLVSGGKPNSAMVGGLFPPEAARTDVLWDAAKEFAALHWYGPAGDLGQQVLKLMPGGRSNYAAEVAEWEIYAGAIPAAREALAIAIDGGGGWTFDANVSPIFSALRQSYLLLAENERPSFIANYLKRLRARGEKIEAVLAGILLHGLAHDEAAARRDLDLLLSMRLLAGDDSGPSVDARRWAYLLANGVQLQSWNLDSLAVYLWRQALQQTSAFDEHFGDAVGTVLEIRRRLLGAEVALASDPEESRGCIAAYLDSSPPPSMVASVAGEMINGARYAAAIQLDEYLCRTAPTDGEHWRSLLSAYETTGDYDRLEQTYERLFQAGRTLPEALARADYLGRWAITRERNGDLDGACGILETERANAPGSIPVLVQLAQLYTRAGKPEQAEGVWREMLPLDVTLTAVLGFAALEEQRGHRDEAIKILEGGTGRGAVGGQDAVQTRLVRLYLAGGQVDRAQLIARTLLREGRFDSLPEVTAILDGGGHRPFARELLISAVGRVRDAGIRYRLQQALVSLYTAAGDDQRGFQRGMARLETFARDTPGAKNNWEIIRYKFARRAGADEWLEKTLRRLWDGGKGDYNAGERLATFYVETRQVDRLRETIDAFDHRPMLPDQLLYGLENALVKDGHAAFALPISERLYRRFPQNIEYGLTRATVLWKAGRTDEATRLLEVIEAGSVLHDELTERVALLYLALGDKDHARTLLERVVQSDPAAVRSRGSFLQLARLYADAGRPREAEDLFRVAYRQEACDDLGPLVDFLAASGQFATGKPPEMPAPDFPLSPRRRTSLLAAVADYLTKGGRKDEARGLWIKYPEFLAESPATAAELCRNAPAQDLPVLLQSLRKATAQHDPPLPRLARTVSELEARLKAGEWSTSDSGRSAAPPSLP